MARARSFRSKSGLEDVSYFCVHGDARGGDGALHVHLAVASRVVLVDGEVTGVGVSVFTKNDVFTNLRGADEIAVHVRAEREVIELVGGPAGLFPDAEAEVACRWWTR